MLFKKTKRITELELELLLLKSQKKSDDKHNYELINDLRLEVSSLQDKVKKLQEVLEGTINRLTNEASIIAEEKNKILDKDK